MDFLVHLQIKSVLNGGEARQVSPQILDNLAERLATTRAATLEAERWLASKYLTRLASGEGVEFKATIIHVNSSGFNVRLDDNGLEGFVDLRKDPEKFSYDKWTASLTSTTRRFQLNQSVELTFLSVDVENQYRALFAPLADCGLKQSSRKPNEPADQ